MSNDEIPALWGQEAVNLWLNGKEVWNLWVKDNPTANVDFSDVDFGKLREERELSNIDFIGFIFPKGAVNFEGASFGNGSVNFRGASFGNGGVYFRDAAFGDSDVDFRHAKFGICKVDFNRAFFGDGDVNFSDASFGGGSVLFIETSFGNGSVNFDRTSLEHSFVGFRGTSFGNGDISFYEATFGKNKISFESASFGDGHLSFHGTIFGDGDVSFKFASFGDGHLSFHGSTIGNSKVDFEGATFGSGEMDFGSIKSDGILHFKNVTWNEITRLDFRGSTLNGPIYIDPQTTKFVPDFRNSIISKKITLHDVRPVLKWTKRTFKSLFRSVAEDPEDASRFLRLIELAMDNHDHLSALAYKANFMRAKRWRSIGILPSILDATVDIVCDYGQSIIRPVAGLLILLTVLTIFHIGYSDQKKLTYTDKAVASAEYVLASSLPFLSNSRAARIESLNILYGEPTLERKPTPAIVSFLTFFQGIMSIIFLFLIGLGLRNRFKL